MALTRRDFLQGSLAAAGSVAAAAALTGCGEDPGPLVDAGGWQPGEVAHLLATASHERIRLKASFRTPRSAAPRLRIAGRVVEGARTYSRGEFFAFDVAGLEPAREYELELLGPTSKSLCDPGPLRTFPSPETVPERFRLLAYTCAGGSDWFRHPLQGRIFQPTGVRQRLLARALSFRPDAVVANGDHVYWDIRSRPGRAMARSPQAWWWAGRFARGEAVLGTPNEEVLKRGFGPQIAGLYGTLFRSVPVFFLQDDHDYTENDEAGDELRTFPADSFMRAVARATQRLYYPEFLAGRAQPTGLVTSDGLAESFGELRYGRLFEGLLYDCRRELTNAADPATGHADSAFVPPVAERWLLERTQESDARHVAHLPSTPILWTAGKWGEWYPDGRDDRGTRVAEGAKPWWARGWLRQHDRLVLAASRRSDRVPLWISGDLHATGMGRMLRTGETRLGGNPVVSILSGTPGTAGPGWPSRFRGQRPVPSLAVEAEEWVEPIEENGFSLIDFEPGGATVRQFRWKPEDGVAAIGRLDPFVTRSWETHG